MIVINNSKTEESSNISQINIQYIIVKSVETAFVKSVIHLKFKNNKKCNNTRFKSAKIAMINTHELLY